MSKQNKKVTRTCELGSANGTSHKAWLVVSRNKKHERLSAIEVAQWAFDGMANAERLKNIIGKLYNPTGSKIYRCELLMDYYPC